MSANKNLLLIGGGGHCKSVLDTILSAGAYHQIGIIDNDSSSSVLGVSVVGTDNDLIRLKEDGWTDAFISVGSIGSTDLRNKLYQMIRKIGFSIPTIIDPSAIVSRCSTIGEGVFVGKMVVVNSGTCIGNCSIINTGSVVEHDCRIGEFSHISPNATLCGQVSVGDNTHIGAGAVIRQGITIGDSSIVGIGSVVVKNIPSGVTAFGNPCKVVV